MNDSYIYVIVALLPLAALMLTIQVNPYHALVIRGILGAVAALVYAVLGAADVALTEALVGTMLAVTLYAVAVRSSLIMRLGVLRDSLSEAENKAESNCFFAQLIADLRTIASKKHLRLELVPYPDAQSLHEALIGKEVHAICIQRSQSNQAFNRPEDELQPYQTTIRIRRLYEIMRTDRLSPITSLSYITPSDIPPSDILPPIPTRITTSEH